MSGLTKFEYLTPLSKLREEYLVDYLEGEVVADLIKTRAMLTAHLMPLPMKAMNPIKETFEAFQEYSQILLPNPKKNVKLEHMDKKELSAISDKLKNIKKFNKELLKKPTSKK